MVINDNHFMIDRCTKFLNYLHIFGWFHHEKDDRLKNISLLHPEIIAYKAEGHTEHKGVEKLGANKGFYISALFENQHFPQDAKIIFEKVDGEIILCDLDDLRKEALDQNSSRMHGLFSEEINKKPDTKILDIGGRARSRLDRSKLYPHHEVTVVDILEGENVDVVGDAHQLSKHFEPDSFDFFLSVSVFEHLLMPWKAAIEIAKILKVGGVGLVHTHQTLGMHDLPWDFWRFSLDAWPALFNEKTGFEIIASCMSHPQFITPFVWREDKADCEKSAGFEGSTVLVRKIGEPKVNWEIEVDDVIKTEYPDHEDGNILHDQLG